MPRTYRSELREQQAEATRVAIVEATWELLRTTRPVDLAYADVARLAGVSTRTVYRHFPTPDALFLAVSDQVFATLQVEPDQRDFTLEQSVHLLRRQYQEMEKDPAIFRAFFAVPTRSRSGGNAFIERLFAPVLDRLPVAEGAAVGGLFDLLCSPYAWDVLHVHWGADAERALRASLVGVRAVLDYLEAHPGCLDPATPAPDLSLEGS